MLSMEIKPISNIGSGQIPNINVSGPSVIPTINPPVSKSIEVPVVKGMELPVINMPDTRIKYPTLNVPTQEEFDAAVNTERQKQAQEQQDKTRGLPDAQPIPPQLDKITQPITPPITTVHTQKYVLMLL